MAVAPNLNANPTLDMTSDLNPNQQEAVYHTEGPLLILAGAGTGKTKVLTSRVAYIIAQNLALPHHILAVTFTNKAALEMAQRINNIISAPGLNIGTFHSLANRVLRFHVNSLDIGISRNFSIADKDEQIKLIKNIATNQEVSLKTYPARLIGVIIAKWKDQGLFPDDIGIADIRNPAQGVAKNIYFEYQKQLRAANTVDFGDLLLYCNLLLKSKPEILEYYQDKFKYILVDEYQDTNAVQYLWVMMLAAKSKNICCVGDDDQSIYSWRGANVANILQFAKSFPEAKIIKLEQNYRSSSYILSAASHIIAHNKNRHKKKLWTDQEGGEKVNIVTCSNEKEEARYIATKIIGLIKLTRFQADQIAILVRASFQTRAFEEIFNSNAIPYQIIGGFKFYERMEIRDLLAYIRLTINRNDNLALERIINVPKRSIGNVTLKKIKNCAEKYNISIFAAIKLMLAENEFRSSLKESLTNFVELIEQAGKNYDSISAHDGTKFLLTESGYLQMLTAEKNEESRARVENINEMLNAIAEFDNIAEFIEHASLVMDNKVLESSFGGLVKIMTLHAAKGLEFDLVFLPGWEDGLFPHQRSLEEGEQGLEEERRIAYVGITRARKQLYITHAENRQTFGSSCSALPSRFLKEIPKNICIKIYLGSNINYQDSSHSFSMQTSYDFTTDHKAYHKAGNTDSTVMLPYPVERKRKSGSKVRHPKFGIGIIVSRNEDNLEIAFEGIGLKTVKEQFLEEV